MKMRISNATVFLASVAALVLTVAIAPGSAAACGDISNLWCAVGCCDGQGNCHIPPSDDFCGYYGGSCNDCTGTSKPYCFNEGVYAQCTACNVFTCPVGCCGDDNLCHSSDADHCGVVGASCQTCSFPNQWCIAGFCTGCNTATCPVGCCDPQGNCHNPPTNDYCGYYGGSCENCVGTSNPYCFDEGAYAQCTACNTLTCPIGCCGSDGLCHNDHNPQYCGTAGASCDTCTGDTPNCIGFICVDCNAATCPVGCCTDDHVCHNDNNTQYCGIAGTDCGTCAGQTPNCYNGYCVGCSDMFPCSDGCCDMTSSTCYAGSSNAECGAVGAECTDCTSSNQFCQSNQCINCNATTCPSGCCDSQGACQTGTQGAACGSGGAACVNCFAQQKQCIGQTCAHPTDDDDDNDDNDNDDNDDDTACGVDNCLAGCCAHDQCWPGNLNAQCGKNAAACANCQTSGQICQDNACVAAADDDASPDDDDDASPADDDDDAAGACCFGANCQDGAQNWCISGGGTWHSDTTCAETTCADDDDDTVDDDASPSHHGGSSNSSGGCGC